MQVRRIIAGHFKTNVKDERVAASTSEILEALTGEKQPTDPVSFMLAGAQALQVEKKILDDLERGLKVNIKRDSDAADIARKIRIDGRSVDTWLAWYRSAEFRLASMCYMTLDKVWAMWPQAFEDAQEQPKPSVPNLTGYVDPNEARYVPNPYSKRPRISG